MTRFEHTPLNLPEHRIGSCALEHFYHEPDHKLSTASVRCRLFGQEAIPLSYSYETRWHRLVEDDRGTWMTDLPCEQAQHEAALTGAEGSVLVGGLGIGLAVALLQEQSAVEHITVVEKSMDICALIGPTLGDNVRLVTEDLFTYLHRTLDTFDFGFYDIWQSDGESTFFDLVLPLRELSVDVVDELHCWNEDVMRGQLMNGLANRFAALCAGWNYVPVNSYMRGLATIQEDTLVNGRSTRDILLKDTTDKYLKWSQRFLRDIDQGKLSPENGERLLAPYCNVYGRHNWEDTWSSMVAVYQDDCDVANSADEA